MVYIVFRWSLSWGFGDVGRQSYVFSCYRIRFSIVIIVVRSLDVDLVFRGWGRGLGQEGALRYLADSNLQFFYFFVYFGGLKVF